MNSSFIPYQSIFLFVLKSSYIWIHCTSFNRYLLLSASCISYIFAFEISKWHDTSAYTIKKEMRYDKYKKRTAIKKEQNDLHIITAFVVIYFSLNLRARHFSIPCRYKITLVHINNLKCIIIKIRTGLPLFSRICCIYTNNLVLNSSLLHGLWKGLDNNFFLYYKHIKFPEIVSANYLNGIQERKRLRFYHIRCTYTSPS